jgi:hypothetical protein
VAVVFLGLFVLAFIRAFFNKGSNSSWVGSLKLEPLYIAVIAAEAIRRLGPGLSVFSAISLKKWAMAGVEVGKVGYPCF